jgi:hypothetical protein
MQTSEKASGKMKGTWMGMISVKNTTLTVAQKANWAVIDLMIAKVGHANHSCKMNK